MEPWKSRQTLFTQFPQPLKNTMKNGFTLIELSIVLVIISLIIGSITVGKSMIRAAELNSLIAEMNRFKSAIDTFEVKYNSLPGDMSDAENYWETSNGNDDGKIDLNSYGPETIAESFLFWNHLAKSEILPGEFSGISGPKGWADCVRNENCPESAIGGMWATRYLPKVTEYSDTVFNITPNNHLVVGVKDPNGWPQYPLMTTYEVYNIDQKVDDGKPALGMVMSWHWRGGCGTTATASWELTANYDLAKKSAPCTILFKF